MQRTKVRHRRRAPQPDQDEAVGEPTPRKPAKSKRQRIAKADYDVGYGKPPKPHQFKPGESGNPKGRPKGRKTLKTQFEKVCEQSVTLKLNGKLQTVRVDEAVLIRMAQNALEGHQPAIRAFLETKARFSDDQSDLHGIPSLSDAEKNLLEDYLRNWAA